jgi:hypothetical protein
MDFRPSPVPFKRSELTQKLTASECYLCWTRLIASNESALDIAEAAHTQTCPQRITLIISEPKAESMSSERRALKRSA